MRQGNLAAAEGFYLEQADAMRMNVAQEPKTVQWQEVRSEALLLLSDAQLMRGRLHQARSNLADAESIVGRLVELDPGNNDWLTTWGICQWQLAQLAAIARDPDADRLSMRAASILANAHAIEPKNERVLRWSIKARDLRAQLALARGDTTTARSGLAESLALLDPAWKASPNEALRLVLVNNRLLAGEACKAGGDSNGARAHWQRAEKLLTADVSSVLPFERLEPMVRALQHLGRVSDAQPHLQRLADAGYVPLRPFLIPPESQLAAH
jgi:tetratricopeptide (TPR) repeat protein